jgi:hypothetical protein
MTRARLTILLLVAVATGSVMTAAASAKPVYYMYRLAPVEASGVRGLATLTRSPSTGALWVSVAVRGAKVGAILDARISRGTCLRPGALRWKLREMNVNDVGQAHGYTRIRRVPAFGRTGPVGLHVAVLDAAGRRVSCATIPAR